LGILTKKPKGEKDMNFIIIALIILTFASRIMGLIREITLAYFYGASAISDAYFISIAIPTVIVTFIFTSIASSFVPTYQKLAPDDDHRNIFTNKVIGLALLLSLAVLIVSFIFTPRIVPLFTSGFDYQARNLTIGFTRITIFAIIFLGMNQVILSYMQVKEKVLLASLSGLPFNLMAILFIFISVHTEIHLLAVGILLAMGLQTLFLLFLAHLQGFRLKPRFTLNDSTVRSLIILTMPMILANAVEQIGVVVEKNIASTFGAGGVSALVYASRVIMAVSGIIVTSVLVVTFPKVSKEAAAGDIKQLKMSLGESIVGMCLFILPAIAAVAVFAQPIVSVIFGRGAFDYYAVSMTSRILFFNIFMLLGHGLSQLFTRVFFALDDSKTPMYVAAITIGVNIALNFSLTSLMGIAGIAISASISAFAGLLALIFLLRKKIGSLKMGQSLNSLKKVASASAIMAILAYLAYDALYIFSPVMALFVAALVGVVIYGILLLLLRIKEVDYLIVTIVNRLKKRLK